MKEPRNQNIYSDISNNFLKKKPRDMTSESLQSGSVHFTHKTIWDKMEHTCSDNPEHSFFKIPN